MCLECLWKSVEVAAKTGPDHCKVCADLLYYEVKLNSLKEQLRLVNDAALLKMEFAFYKSLVDEGVNFLQL